MTDCVDVDGTDASDLTRAQIACRRQMDEIHGFLRYLEPCHAIQAAFFIKWAYRAAFSKKMFCDTPLLGLMFYKTLLAPR